MSDFIARLQEEYTQLHLRIEKLKTFILSEKFDGLPDIDRSDLKKQLKHMHGYYDTLKCRVSRLCG